MPQGKGTYGNKVGRPSKKTYGKKTYDPKKGTPKAVKSMSAKTQGSGKAKAMPTIKSKPNSAAKGFYMKPKTKVTKR